MRQHLFGFIATVIFFALSFTLFAFFFERETLQYYLQFGIGVGIINGALFPLIKKWRKSKAKKDKV